MRIALLQTCIRPNGRSANLARVLVRVAAAAELVPAPDLLVLPGTCDGAESEGLNEAMAQGFAESIGAAAREWGLYIAAGLCRVDGRGTAPAALLFDADGDVIRCAQPGTGFVAESSLGRIGLTLTGHGAPLQPPEAACDLLVVLTCRAETGAGRDPDNDWCESRLAEIAVRHGTAVCAVTAVRPDTSIASAPNRHSLLLDASGQCVAAAEPGIETTIVGRIPAAEGAEA